MLMDWIGPFLALLATMIMGALAKIPMKIRPWVAVAGGILLNLFVNNTLADGFQVRDIVDGVLIGLTAVGMYSATKNVGQDIKARLG